MRKARGNHDEHSAAETPVPASTEMPSDQPVEGEQPQEGKNTEGGFPDNKPKDFKRTAKQLLSYGKSYVPIMVVALVLAAVGSIFNVIGPEFLSQMTDYIAEGLSAEVNMEGVRRVGVILAVLYGLGLLFSYVQGYITATISQRVTQRMRTEISHKINRIPLKYFDNTSYGNVLSRVTNDADLIAQTLNNSLGGLVGSAVMFVGALVMMFYTNWIMALSAIVVTVIGFVLLSALIRLSQKHFVAQQAELGLLNGHIEEMYAGHQVVKVFNGERGAIAHFHDINSRLYTSAWKSQFLSGLMMPIMMFVGNLSYVVVCLVGAVLVTSGHITMGVIVAFMIYVRLFTQPLSQIAQAASSLQATAAASERVFEFLAEEELEDESYKSKQLGKVKGKVSFRNVRFGYREDQTVIRDFSVEVEAGQKIAIVGPTGAGKTTLVNLLMRFYELTDGEICIDGVPISELTREQVHAQFCMVLQDTWLFEGTIRDNIVYANPNVADEQVEEVCKAVGIHHFIQTLPEGYNTILNDQANLSAGQKQLITIARAMIDEAPLLILDEATSSVDTRTELLIQQAMDRLSVGKTSFVIAHRLSTIKNADLILVMKDGDIIESGTHDQLLSKGGFYADLYNSQFEAAS